LPAASGEAQRIATTYGETFPQDRPPKLLTGDVDAGRVKTELSPSTEQTPYRYLHLATHGFFEPPAADTRLVHAFTPGELPARAHVRNPLLLSGLVFAGANRDPQTGTLTAEEVSGLDLRGCELVVLSACETGLGKVAGGEGVLGLQLAFQAAGAWALVTSLWSVNDAATAVLMEEFYANLWQKKMSKIEALRQAQLKVLNDPGTVSRRAEELLAELKKKGVTKESLANRGFEDRATELPKGAEAKRGHARLWAAFVICGDGR
jgi:CHAT domain-containing protein